jgi:hypothetical protein
MVSYKARVHYRMLGASNFALLNSVRFAGIFLQPADVSRGTEIIANGANFEASHPLAIGL